MSLVSVRHHFDLKSGLIKARRWRSNPRHVRALLIAAAGCGAAADYRGADHEAIFTTFHFEARLDATHLLCEHLGSVSMTTLPHPSLHHQRYPQLAAAL